MTIVSSTKWNHGVIRMLMGMLLFGTAVSLMSPPLRAWGYYSYEFQSGCVAEMGWGDEPDCAYCWLAWDECVTQCSECRYYGGGTPEEGLECLAMCRQAKDACRGECIAWPPN